VATYFAGQAVGTNFLGRSGIVLNPNLELLFQGPKLRSFRYNYTFTPRDEEEAREIRRIIKVLKKTMAPRKTQGSLFLGVPAVYQIRYIYSGGGDHPFLNKLKPCALTAFNFFCAEIPLKILRNFKFKKVSDSCSYFSNKYLF
jgi:hypothetical protein